MTIAAVLIARDEAAMLPGCLEALHGLVDEIVVLDTGSTDDTVAIAESYGARVGRAFWNDDFSAARNAALALATTDLALWIDADERPAPGFRDTLDAARANPGFGGFEIGILNDLGEESFVHRAVRLFRREPRIRFEGRVHEGVGDSLAREGLNVAALDGPGIVHLGYRPEIMAAKDKLARDLRLLETQVAEHPRDPFVLFNLANARHCAGDWAGTIEAARRILLYLDESAPYAPNLAAITKGAFLALNDPGGALDWPTPHTAHALVAYEEARAWAMVGEFGRAVARAGDAIAAAPPAIGDPAVRLWKARLLRARALSALGDHGAALADARRLVDDVSLEGDAREAYLSVFGAAAAARPEEAADLLHEAERATAAPEIAAFRLGLGRSFFATGEREAAHALFLRAARDASADARFCLGDSHYARGEWALAVGAYESGLGLDPGRAEGWFTLGNALAQMGADAVAERCYRQTLTLHPGHPGALGNLHALAA